MEELDELTRYFAEAMESVDARRPIASNARTGAPYSPGIGPHTERATVQLVSEEMERQGSIQVQGFQLEVPYPDTPWNKCDLCIGVGPDWDWAVEIKMLRLMGDNGKPNDNILMHILSPYPEHRSALTDCTKLSNAGFTGRTGLSGVRLHDLRHTHASLMLQQGTDIKTISTRLGHSSVAFTMDTYAHLLPGMQKAAMEKFEEAFAVTGQNS